MAEVAQNLRSACAQREYLMGFMMAGWQVCHPAVSMARACCVRLSQCEERPTATSSVRRILDCGTMDDTLALPWVAVPCGALLRTATTG